jgi:hypothetical protein
MKTSVSIPDELFSAAEKTAKQLGIPFGSEPGFRRPVLGLSGYSTL